MRKIPLAGTALLAGIFSGLFVAAAAAHGYVGDRFFPPTISTEDPLVTDELSLPLSIFSAAAGDEEPETRTLVTGFEFAKVIIPKMALGISYDYLWQRPRGGHSARGPDNLGLSIKYELCRDVPHEFILSIGLDSDIGGTGARRIGRESFSTFTPTLYFGKGFGDLPDALAPLKPFALTGTLGQTFPTESPEPNALQWGLALEYSLPYLQQHVRDIGLPAPFKDMIPLVEFACATTENRGAPGITTGTINPGILWEGRYFQVGVEALIPLTHDSGAHVGALVTFDIYIDDLFPTLFGHPLFGE